MDRQELSGQIEATERLLDELRHPPGLSLVRTILLVALVAAAILLGLHLRTVTADVVLRVETSALQLDLDRTSVQNLRSVGLPYASEVEISKMEPTSVGDLKLTLAPGERITAFRSDSSDLVLRLPEEALRKLSLAVSEPNWTFVTGIPPGTEVTLTLLSPPVRLTIQGTDGKHREERISLASQTAIPLVRLRAARDATIRFRTHDQDWSRLRVRAMSVTLPKEIYPKATGSGLVRASAFFRSIGDSERVENGTNLYFQAGDDPALATLTSGSPMRLTLHGKARRLQSDRDLRPSGLDVFMASTVGVFFLLLLNTVVTMSQLIQGLSRRDGRRRSGSGASGRG